METQQAAAPTFEGWALVEIFGHVRMAGKVSEQAIGGASFIRIDVPEVPETPEREVENPSYYTKPTRTVPAVPAQPAFTRFYGAAAIYSMTPCTEEVARAAAAQLRSEPISVCYLPEPMRAIASSTDDSCPFDDVDPDDNEEAEL